MEAVSCARASAAARMVLRLPAAVAPSFAQSPAPASQAAATLPPVFACAKAYSDRWFHNRNAHVVAPAPGPGDGVRAAGLGGLAWLSCTARRPRPTGPDVGDVPARIIRDAGARRRAT